MDILKLLLIDDDPISNFLTKTVIRKASIEATIITSDNAESALSIFKDYRDVNEIPNTIFLDLNMPLMNGWEFIEHFSTLNEEVKEKISLFILSASNNQNDISKASNYPFVKKYINKPIEINEVRELFSKHVYSEL